jgi:hypothetical protein
MSSAIVVREGTASVELDAVEIGHANGDLTAHYQPDHLLAAVVRVLTAAGDPRAGAVEELFR